MSGYFDDPRISASALRDLAKSPLHYYAKHVAKTVPREETAALRLGTAVHAAILEPGVFARDYVVATWDARTKDGKAQRDAAIASGKIVISDDDETTICAMAQSVHEHPIASAILASRIHTEEPIFWTDPLSGIECKGKPDMVCRVGGRTSIVDLKTTNDANEDDFARSIANYAYHVQAAMYLRGWREVSGEEASFTILAVEKSAPYAVAIYELDEDAIAKGSARVIGLLQRLKACRESNSWPGYATKTISLPRWAA